jgi:hypothetical protein
MNKTAQQHINEYIESQKEYVIPICEIWAFNKPNTKRCTINVVKKGDSYYFQAFNGNLSTRYNSISQAKLDIKDLWGDWIDFKFLI